MSNKDNQYIKIARIWAENSYSKRLKVGAIIVKDKMIISDGYNGMPAGFPNSCEYKRNGKLITRKAVLHAEANAITKLAKSPNSSEGATIYTLVSPCFDCSKLIIQSGIKRVVYQDEFRDLSGIKLLMQAGIEVEKIN